LLRSALILLAFAAGAPLQAQLGSRDPEFAKIPFDAWIAAGKQAVFKWNIHLTKPQLSVHQRLFAEVEVIIDGVELAKRRGQGQFVIFVQIKDSSGVSYQDHGNIDLQKVEESVKASNITFSDTAFFLPGDYSMDVALYATGTKEYAVKKSTLHVAPLIGDPLTGSWSGLPPVEFRPVSEPPDSWFLPRLKGRVQLNAAPQHPQQIELIANITPSERDSGSLRIQDRNLSFLIPALKVFAQTEFRNASLSVSLIDMVKQKIPFHQENVTTLDWLSMRSSLAAADPGVIDVKSLEKSMQKARFFIREINKRVGETPSSKVLIILSTAVAFGSEQDLEPLHLETPTDAKVFYLRYQAEPARVYYGPQQPVSRRRGGRMPGQNISLIGPPVDQLAPVLKALAPKVFDVKSPIELRKAIAAILKEISAL